MCGILWLGDSLGGVFFFQAEDGIRDLVRSRGLGDVYKRQRLDRYQPGRFFLRVGGGCRQTGILAGEWPGAVCNLSLIHI